MKRWCRNNFIKPAFQSNPIAKTLNRSMNQSSTLSITLSIALSLVLHNTLLIKHGYAQNGTPSVQEVKLSGGYHWGEGYAPEREAAIDIARQDLAKRMVVTIVSDQSSTETETNQEYSSDYRSNVQMMSRLEIRGLENMAWQRRDKSWEAVAFISKMDHKENLNAQAEQIYNKLDQVLAMEKEEKTLSAESFALYRDIYLSTLFYPEILFSESERHGKKADIRRWAINKIQEDLNNLTIKVREVANYSTEQQVEIYVELDVLRNGTPADDLTVRLDREGYGWHRIQNGTGTLYYDRLLDNRTEDIPIEIAIDPEAITDPAFKGIPSDLLPGTDRIIAVDFADVISLDINVESLGQRRLRFKPAFNNLSVFDIAWEIDGKEVSRTTPLDHTFPAGSGPSVVTVRLNRVDGLTLSKKVWPDGRIEEIQSDASTVGTRNTSAGRLGSTRPGSTRLGDTSSLRARPTSRSENRTTNDRADVNRQAGTRQSGSPQSGDRSSAFSTTAGRTLGRTDFVPRSQDRIIRGFQTKTRLSSLVGHLTDLQNGRLLQFGNRRDVPNTSMSYMIIADPSSDRVVTILSPEKNGKRYNLLKGEAIETTAIRDTFKGYGPVYVQFLRN